MLTPRMCTVDLTLTHRMCTAVRAYSCNHHVSKYIFLCDESKGFTKFLLSFEEKSASDDDCCFKEDGRDARATETKATRKPQRSSHADEDKHHEEKHGEDDHGEDENGQDDHHENDHTRSMTL